MLKKFKSQEVENLANRYPSPQYPLSVNKLAPRKLLLVAQAKNLRELSNYPANRLEKLVGNKWSIRISKQYRIVFIWENNQAWEIDINKHDKKYGK